MQTNLETNALAVIDVLAQAGDIFTADYGQVLVELTRAIYGEDKKVGDPEYKAISMAVLYLEQADLVTVERAHRDESQKANIVLSIRLA